MVGAMSNKRWFRFHIERWRDGTFGLSPNEIAAYITVLCELYDQDGFAKLNCRVMAMRCGMRPSSFQKAIDKLVARGKLDVSGGFLTNKAVSSEIVEREKLGKKSAESRSKLGKKSAKNAINSTDFSEKYPLIQNTNNKYISSFFSEPQENLEIHPSVQAALARQRARKW
jgi:hypothetical protein